MYYLDHCNGCELSSQWIGWASACWPRARSENNRSAANVLYVFISINEDPDNALPRFLIGLIQTWYGSLIQTWYGSGERFGKFCPLAPSLEEPFITAAEVRTNQSWIISISVHESRTVARDKMTMTSPRDNRTILCLRTRDNDSATRPSRSKVGHF